MKCTIKAIYKNGSFKPLEPVGLNDDDEVSMTIETMDGPAAAPQGLPGRDYMELVGLISGADLDQMEEAIRDCRQVDEAGW